MAEVFVRSPWQSQVHECDEMKAELAKMRTYPHLITEIYMDMNEKKPAATNGADISFITFCPFCGINLTNNE